MIGNIIFGLILLAAVALIVFKKEVSKRSIIFVVGVGIFFIIIEVIRQTTHWL